MAKKLNPISVWALAAGGMVGGGIYTVLGVVVAVSGQWSWLSFLFIGILAVTAGYSYVFLTNKFMDSGGAFAFLNECHDKAIAGNLAWLLILGYVFTISVYAFAFGHYVSFAFDGNATVIRLLAAGIIVALILLNLAGVGKLTKVEIAIVAANLAILLALGIYGLTQWDSTQLVAGIEPRPFWSALVGGGAIFMGYEGFQLVTYEYEHIKNPEKNFMPVIISAVIFVVILYIIVALGATFLAGAASLIEFKAIALSITSQKAFGTTGVVIMAVAAGLATAAAINSTLFSTANLTKTISEANELPQWFKQTNSNDIPDRAIILLGVFAGIFAIAGSLTALVEAASLVFVITFGVVNWLCFREGDSKRWIPAIGIGIAVITTITLLFRVAVSKPYAFGALLLIILLVILGRPFVLKQKQKKNSDEESK